MNSQAAQALIERTRRHIAEKTSERGAPGRIAASAYLDADRLQAEQTFVLRALPVCLGPVAAVAERGSFFTHDFSGLPLLVVRGSDDRVRVLLNACRHRGTRLISEPGGTARVIVCPYHSWTYSLDGALRGMPHADCFAHLSGSETHLVEFPAYPRAGMVWTVLQSGDVAHNIAAALQPILQDAVDWGYDNYVPYKRRVLRKACNWKLIVDGALETYHFQYAHTKTIAHMFFDNLLVSDVFGDHQRLMVPKREIADPEYGNASLGEISNLIYHVFPNAVLLYEGDHANVLTVWPDGPHGCVIDGTMLIPDVPHSDKAASHWAKNYEIFWTALEEDFALGVSIHGSLKTGLVPHVNFGATEIAALRFHARVERRLADDARSRQMAAE